jgi:hypothetical protein
VLGLQAIGPNVGQGFGAGEDVEGFHDTTLIEITTPSPHQLR